jgi:hypothetical protein
MSTERRKFLKSANFRAIPQQLACHRLLSASVKVGQSSRKLDLAPKIAPIRTKNKNIF